MAAHHVGGFKSARSSAATVHCSLREREMTGAAHPLSTQAHAAGLFGDIPFSGAKVDRLFDRTLERRGQHLGLVVCLGERVMGCCHASLGGTFIGEGARIVPVTTFHFDSECTTGLLGGKVALRLVKGIEVWARARGATRFQCPLKALYRT